MVFDKIKEIIMEQLSVDESMVTMETNLMKDLEADSLDAVEIIMAIEEDGEMHVTSGNIYTVDGRLVRQNATSLEDLPKGIYIVDGKKYFVK